MTTEYVRLLEDLFYVTTPKGADTAVSTYHAGRNFGTGKSYFIHWKTDKTFPALLSMSMIVDRDMRAHIDVYSEHLPELSEKMMSESQTAKEKVEFLEQHLSVTLT